jgi:uncharacterized membrane protein YeaQ/YmgE (transglycosylase-associated protein family)
MEIALWILTGGALGWIGYSYLNYNEERGMKISILIGIAGGFLGGEVLAPFFVDAAPASAAFSPSTLIFAAVAAAGFLFIGDLVHKRWGV